MGDESFPKRTHHSLPIIRVAGVPPPSSDPIVIETEPVVTSPARSNSGSSQPHSSPPRSPPVPRRFNSVSSASNSDNGRPQSNTFTPPLSSGVQTPPNSWAPHIQEPRPPPTDAPPSYTRERPIIMPAPTTYSYTPYPDEVSPRSAVPPIPPKIPLRATSPNNSWSAQEIRQYRSSIPGLTQINPSPSAVLQPSPNLSRENSNTLQPMPSNSSFAPYSPDFQPTSQQGPEQEYVYKPSAAKRGRGGRHRTQSWLDSRSRTHEDQHVGVPSSADMNQYRYYVTNS